MACPDKGLNELKKRMLPKVENHIIPPSGLSDFLRTTDSKTVTKICQKYAKIYKSIEKYRNRKCVISDGLR